MSTVHRATSWFLALSGHATSRQKCIKKLGIFLLILIKLVVESFQGRDILLVKDRAGYRVPIMMISFFPIPQELRN
jgi:hypothetical protein